ncbi:MAG: formylglycine-generating enzyme family protein [Candidatus Delongbacteria bacterium]|nr:formylglycine-generating enzyme family protein [Candidatus Delongbacteria bacterium]
MRKIILILLIFIVVSLQANNKEVIIDKSKYSKHLDGVSMNISTGEIQAISEDFEPPEGFELYVDPATDGIFDFYEFDSSKKILYIGYGTDIFKDWVKYLEKGISFKQMNKNESLEGSVVYIGGLNDACILFIKAYDKNSSSMTLIWENAGKSTNQSIAVETTNNDPNKTNNDIVKTNENIDVPTQNFEEKNEEIQKTSQIEENKNITDAPEKRTEEIIIPAEQENKNSDKTSPIKVKLKKLINDNTASIRKVSDPSGKACALIKVMTDMKNLNFNSEHLTKASNYKNGEYKLYVSSEIKELNITWDSNNFRYNFETLLEQENTYRMTIIQNYFYQQTTESNNNEKSPEPIKADPVVSQPKKSNPDLNYVYQPDIDIPDIDMIFVKGGRFIMGSNNSFDNNKPEHEVYVNDFYINKNEVTQKLWKAILPTKPFHVTGDNFPVDVVNWYEAVEFCNILSEKMKYQQCYIINKNTGNENQWNVICNFDANGFRLPTEAEWEYVAKYNNFSTENINLDDIAWYKDNSQFISHPVADKSPNSLGIYDLFGNVSEWCWDWYLEDCYTLGVSDNPTGPAFAETKVLRGGSMLNTSDYVSTISRENKLPHINQTPHGFRLVRSKK